jgi:hypothetical protein
MSPRERVDVVTPETPRKPLGDFAASSNYYGGRHERALAFEVIIPFFKGF